MTKETITYTDLNGVQRTEDFYFDLSKPEIVKMQASAKGGYDVQLKSIAASPNGALASTSALKDLKLTTRVELKLKVLAHLMLILRMPPLSLLKSCLERLRM